MPQRRSPIDWCFAAAWRAERFGEGDFADPASLRRAFAGFNTLFLLLPLVPNKLQLAAHAVEAARAAGIRHIVRSSGAGAGMSSAVSIARLQGRIDARHRRRRRRGACRSGAARRQELRPDRPRSAD